MVADGEAPRTIYDKLAQDLWEYSHSPAVQGVIPRLDVRMAARMLEYIPRLLCALAVPAEFWRAYFKDTDVDIETTTEELFRQWLTEYQREIDEAITVSNELMKPS